MVSQRGFGSMRLVNLLMFVTFLTNKRDKCMTITRLIIINLELTFVDL